MFPFPNAQMAAGGYGAPAWTWNPADAASGVVLSNNDRSMRTSGSAGAVRGTISKASGAWYFEVVVDDGTPASVLGIAAAGMNLVPAPGQDAFAWGWQGFNGQVWTNGGSVASYATFATGDRIGVAFDRTALKLWLAKNGVWQSGNPNTAAGGLTITAQTYFPVAYSGTGATPTFTAPRSLLYPPPSGFGML